MPLRSAGHAASSSGFAIGLRAQEIGSPGIVAQHQRSSLIGSYVMATAEHREPCESRGSCTVLGARGGETPPRDSTLSDIATAQRDVCFSPKNGHWPDGLFGQLRAKLRHPPRYKKTSPEPGVRRIQCGGPKIM